MKTAVWRLTQHSHCTFMDCLVHTALQNSNHRSHNNCYVETFKQFDQNVNKTLRNEPFSCRNMVHYLACIYARHTPTVWSILWCPAVMCTPCQSWCVLIPFLLKMNNLSLLCAPSPAQHHKYSNMFFLWHCRCTVAALYIFVSWL